MNQFKITLYSDTTLAKEILKGWQYKVYLIKLRSFLTIIEKKLSKYKSVSEKDKKIFIDESEDLEYLNRQKKELEAFLFADSSELGGDKSKEYQSLVNDRIIQKLSRTAHKLGSKLKDKALRSALGGQDVLSFFAKMGIAVVWEIK